MPFEGTEGDFRKEGTKQKMKDLFKIGEIAELFHLNIKTLRYYDEIDLVKPETVDPGTGYRYYSTRQFEQINTILYLRELGVPLSEIRDFLRGRETEKMEKILKSQIDQVEKKQKELENIKKKLTARIISIQDAKEGKLNAPEIKRFPVRQALLLRCSMKPDSDFEYPIRLLAKDVPAASVFLGKIGLSIDATNIQRGRFYEYNYIFLLLDDTETEEPNDYRGKEHETVSFKGGSYAVIRFRGTHSDAEKNYRRLMLFVKKEGYEPAGHSLEITLIDAGFTTDEKQYVTEIQLPVKKIRK